MRTRPALRCPSCAIPLRPADFAPGAARCPRCDGVLATAPSVAGRSRVVRESTVVCPACLGLMDVARAGAAELALCPRCGVSWLDSRAVDALASSGEADLASFAEEARASGRGASRSAEG